MAADVTPTRIGGALIVPDPRLTFEAFSPSLSTSSAGAAPLTQAGPLPGTLEPQGSSAMVLETIGSRSANQVLQVLTVHAGNPEPDGAAFVWRPETGGEYYGWDPPYSIADFEFVDRSTTAGEWTHPHAIAGGDGRVHVAAVQTGQAVIVWTRSATGVWSSASVYDAGAATTYGLRPTLCRLPSGRLLCFFWRERAASVTVRMHYSDDDGASWIKGQPSCLRTTINPATATPKRLRVGHLNSQLILIAHLQASGTDELHQYASNDGGASFVEIAALDDTSRGFPDLIVSGGRIYVGYVKRTGSTPAVLPFVISLGSVYESIATAVEQGAYFPTDTAEWGTITGGALDAGECALVADEDGSLWFFGRDEGSGTAEIIASRSINGGDSWDQPGNGHASNSASTFSNPIWYGRDSGTFPTQLSACCQGGRVALFHTANSAGPANDSLMGAYLGGYTTVCLPVQAAIADPTLDSMVTWEHTWLPYGLPDDIASSVYTRVSGGSATVTLTNAGLRVVHSGGSDAEQWSQDLTTTVLQGAFALVQIQVSVGGPAFAQLINAEAGTSYAIRVEVTPTAITLVDVEASTTLATVSTTAGVDGVQILLGLRSGGAIIQYAEAWYRAVRADTPARGWTSIGSAATLASGSTPTAAFSWGTLAGHATTDARFKLAHCTSGTYVGAHLAPAPDNYGDLLGRAYATTPVTITDGLSMYAVDGPTYRNESWQEQTRYEYGVELLHVDVEPSPRKGWRSTDTTAHELVWEVGASISDTHGAMEGMSGVYLGEVNWRTGSFWGRTSGGAWVKICDIDTAAGTVALKYDRAGSILTPVSGGSPADRYLLQHSLAGSTFALNSDVRRRIRTNGSGAWPGVTGNTRSARLLLDAPETGDPASGSAGAIWSKDVLVLVPGVSAYSAFKLTIDSQDTADGYLAVGTFVSGAVVLLRYGWGRALGLDFGFEMSEGRSGVRAVKTLAPPRRWVEFDHADNEVNSRQLYGQTPSPLPDFLRAYVGGPAIATKADTLYSILGTLGYLGGATVPAVYLDGWTVGLSSAAITVTNRERFFFGRLVSESYGLDAIMGDESYNEIHRGRRLRFEQET